MRSLNRSLLTRTPSASKIMARTICFEMGSFYASSSRGSRGSGSCAIGTGGSPIPAIGDRLRSPQPQLRCRSAELRLGPRASSGARTFADRRAGAHRLAADWAVGAVLGGALVIAAFIFWRPETSAPTTDSPIASSTLQNGTGRELEVVAEDLEVPWEIAFLPEGGMLVTERPGYLTVLGKERRRIPVPGVRAGGEDAAQSTRSLAGKILRVRDDGSIPEDNPFGNAVYSYGHRNPQGLAWDDEGRLWATEHGRSGALSGLDELNLVEKGVNYGWPVIKGAAERSGMRAPAIQSGASVTWAPAGAAYLNGRIFFAGLRGSALYETAVSADGKASAPETHLLNEFGRLRAPRLGPDGSLSLPPPNVDGGGRGREGDDKLIRVRPGALGEEQR